jgi:high-affinity K+ transport system ATPase subunit B
LINLVKNKDEKELNDFTVEEENTFSEKLKKFTTNISISVISLFVFEVLRIICLLFSVSSTLINIIYVFLIFIGVVCLAIAGVMYKAMYNYIKSII